MANPVTSGINTAYNFLFHPIASAQEGKGNKGLRTIGSLAIAVFTLGSVHAISAALKGVSWLASKTTPRESMSGSQKESAVKTEEVGKSQLVSPEDLTPPIPGYRKSEAQKLKTPPSPPSNYQAVDQYEPELSASDLSTSSSQRSSSDERMVRPPLPPSGYEVENRSNMTQEEISEAIKRERGLLDKREAELDNDEVVINADPQVNAISSRIQMYSLMKPYVAPQEEIGIPNPSVSNPLDRVLSPEFQFKVADPQSQKGDDLKLHYANFLNPILNAADELLKLADAAKSPAEIKIVEEKTSKLEAKALGIWQTAQDALSDTKLTNKLNQDEKDAYLNMLTLSYQTIQSENNKETVMNKLKEVNKILKNKPASL